MSCTEDPELDNQASALPYGIMSFVSAAVCFLGMIACSVCAALAVAGTIVLAAAAGYGLLVAAAVFLAVMTVAAPTVLCRVAMFTGGGHGLSPSSNPWGEAFGAPHEC